MRSVPSEFDIVVAGGGPAGSATAGLLAQKGYSVLLLERDKFPRYHIGESVVTGIIPTLQELGIYERVDEMGFVRKYGGTLMWGRNQGVWDFRFGDVGQYDYAYQVRRADFDALLLTRARELGVSVIEEASVKDVIHEDGRVVGAEYYDKGSDAVKSVRSRLFIDATGQQHLLGRKFGLTQWHEDLRNVAIWSYFGGCELYEGTRAGDVISENRPGGWFWFIPLFDNTVSIGYVTPIDELKNSGKSLETLFHEELALTEECRRLTEHAYPVSSFRTARDWSYESRQLAGPGWALVGDAAAFVDPLLAHGVTLALLGAKGLADTLGQTIDRPQDQDYALARYDKNYRDFVQVILEFVRFFYDRTKHKEDYWAKAQEAIDPDRLHPKKQDFATLLSGTLGLHKIFDATAGTLFSDAPRSAETVPSFE